MKIHSERRAEHGCCRRTALILHAQQAWWLVPMVVSLFLIGRSHHPGTELGHCAVHLYAVLERSVINQGMAAKVLWNRSSLINERHSSKSGTASTRSSAESKPNTRLRSGLWIGPCAWSRPVPWRFSTNWFRIRPFRS